jgi:hypothetical protein
MYYCAQLSPRRAGLRCDANRLKCPWNEASVCLRTVLRWIVGLSIAIGGVLVVLGAVFRESGRPDGRAVARTGAALLGIAGAGLLADWGAKDPTFDEVSGNPAGGAVLIALAELCVIALAVALRRIGASVLPSRRD